MADNPYFIDINKSTASTTIDNYNIEVLQKIFQHELQQSITDDIPRGDGRENTPSENAATASNTAREAENKEDKLSVAKPTTGRDPNWRHMTLPSVMDFMIISSYGDEWESSIAVVAKQEDNQLADTVSSKTALARKEMEIVIDTGRRDNNIHLQEVCPDWPTAQSSKSDTIERIKLFLEYSNREESDHGG